MRLPQKLAVLFYAKPFIIEFPQTENNNLPIGNGLLSQAGQELAPICESAPCQGFQEYVVTRRQNTGLLVTELPSIPTQAKASCTKLYSVRMARTTKTLGFSVPPQVVREVEILARKERRTKSELFREMVRVYQRFRLQRDRDEMRWVENLIEETKAEQAKNPMTVEEMLAENERLLQYGVKRAKQLGIKTDLASATRIIHERRKARRAP